jgi:hypothetical protein
VDGKGDGANDADGLDHDVTDSGRITLIVMV